MKTKRTVVALIWAGVIGADALRIPRPAFVGLSPAPLRVIGAHG